jgi:ABC-type transport system involved in multi-copper enzyme maturation permease subunit
MGIHDTGYRTFKGRVGGRLERIWAIFIQEFNFKIRQRNTIIMLILCYALGVFPTVLFTYVLISFSIVAGEDAASNIFSLYFSLLFIWIIIYTTIMGSTLISNDLKHNSIILYFSRPLTKEDYFLGKMLSIFVLILLVTLIPALFMSITILGLATEELTKYMDIVRVVSTIISISIFMAFVFSTLSLILSSMTKNYLYAGVGIFTLLAFSNIIAILFSEIVNDNFALLSIWHNFVVMADDGAGFNNMDKFHWYNSLGILTTVSLISMFGAWRKIKSVEVI